MSDHPQEFHIGVAVRDDMPSRMALEWALKEFVTPENKSELLFTLVHVVSDVTNDHGRRIRVNDADISLVHSHVRDNVLPFLETFQESCDYAEVTSAIEVVRNDLRPEALVEFAMKKNVGYLILGGTLHTTTWGTIAYCTAPGKQPPGCTVISVINGKKHREISGTGEMIFNTPDFATSTVLGVIESENEAGSNHSSFTITPNGSASFGSAGLLPLNPAMLPPRNPGRRDRWRNRNRREGKPQAEEESTEDGSVESITSGELAADEVSGEIEARGSGPFWGIAEQEEVISKLKAELLHQTSENTEDASSVDHSAKESEDKAFVLVSVPSRKETPAEIPEGEETISGGSSNVSETQSEVGGLVITEKKAAVETFHEAEQITAGDIFGEEGGKVGSGNGEAAKVFPVEVDSIGEQSRAEDPKALSLNETGKAELKTEENFPEIEQDLIFDTGVSGVATSENDSGFRTMAAGKGNSLEEEGEEEGVAYKEKEVEEWPTETESLPAESPSPVPADKKTQFVEKPSNSSYGDDDEDDDDDDDDIPIAAMVNSETYQEEKKVEKLQEEGEVKEKNHNLAEEEEDIPIALPHMLERPPERTSSEVKVITPVEEQDLDTVGTDGLTTLERARLAYRSNSSITQQGGGGSRSMNSDGSGEVGGGSSSFRVERAFQSARSSNFSGKLTAKLMTPASLGGRARMDRKSKVEAEIAVGRAIRESMGQTIVPVAKPIGDFRIFTAQELQVAMDYFSPNDILGEGSYGIVYRGNLEGVDVAIKQLKNSDMKACMEEINRELEVQKRCDHPNLVKLIGYSIEDRSLVYEFLSNGSLEDRLLCIGESPPLLWPDRCRIAMETAAALHHLHTREPPIVHRDVKPANVLLDEHFVAKLGDVGLARLMVDMGNGNTHIVRKSVIVGTEHYVDPEYLCARRGYLGPKSDVYSFGIVLLQMLVGGIPNLRKIDMAVEQENLLSMLDPKAGEWPEELAMDLANLGLWCSEMDRRDRPDLEEEVIPALLEICEVAAKEVVEVENRKRRAEAEALAKEEALKVAREEAERMRAAEEAKRTESRKLHEAGRSSSGSRFEQQGPVPVKQPVQRADGSYDQRPKFNASNPSTTPKPAEASGCGCVLL